MMVDNLFPHPHQVTRGERSKIKGHQPVVIWLTGYSGSGKSTIANALETTLVTSHKVHAYLLDGDNIRTGLNAGLGFSGVDRKENIRRIGEVAKLMLDAGLIVITAFISPFQSDRDQVRSLFNEGEFWEVFVDCPLEICKQRDPKGLYKKAEAGQIPDFTGISSPYEAPLAPELTINTAELNVEECVDKIIELLMDKKIIKRSDKG